MAFTSVHRYTSPGPSGYGKFVIYIYTHDYIIYIYIIKYIPVELDLDATISYIGISEIVRPFPFHISLPFLLGHQARRLLDLAEQASMITANCHRLEVRGCSS